MEVMFPNRPEGFNSAPKITVSDGGRKKRARPEDTPKEFNQTNMDEERPKVPTPQNKYIELLTAELQRFNQLALSPKPDKAQIKAQGIAILKTHPGGDNKGVAVAPDGSRMIVNTVWWEAGYTYRINPKFYARYKKDQVEKMKSISESLEMQQFCVAVATVTKVCNGFKLKLPNIRKDKK